VDEAAAADRGPRRRCVAASASTSSGVHASACVCDGGDKNVPNVAVPHLACFENSTVAASAGQLQPARSRACALARACASDRPPAAVAAHDDWHYLPCVFMAPAGRVRTRTV